jgi:hypothetical protein
MVSSTLVEAVIERVKNGSMTIEQASIELGKQCTCNIFNSERAIELIEGLSK